MLRAHIIRRVIELSFIRKSVTPDSSVWCDASERSLLILFQDRLRQGGPFKCTGATEGPTYTYVSPEQRGGGFGPITWVDYHQANELTPSLCALSHRNFKSKADTFQLFGPLSALLGTLENGEGYAPDLFFLSPQNFTHYSCTQHPIENAIKFSRNV